MFVSAPPTPTNVYLVEEEETDPSSELSVSWEMSTPYNWFYYLTLTSVNGEIEEHGFISWEISGGNISTNQTISFSYKITGLNPAQNYSATMQIENQGQEIGPSTLGNISLPSNFAITGIFVCKSCLLKGFCD